MPIHEKYYPPNQEPPKESIIERYTPEPEPYPQEPEIEYETIETCSSPIEPEQTNIFHEKIAGDYIGEVVNRTIIGNSISAQPKPKTITPIHERILPYVVMDGGYTLDITPAEYQDVTNGLVGWWKLEGDGTDSYDGLPATVIGAIPTTDRFDRENSALYFDGINDVADIGTSTDLRINAVTVCGWFKTNSNTAGWLFVKKARSYGGWVGYGVNLGLYETGKIAVRIQQSASPSFIDKRITKSFNDNKWHHVAFTYTGSIFRLYYDGVREPTMDGTGGAIYYYENHNASIGAERSISVWENFFVGSISDVRVYNRALSESEISVVYNRVLNVTTTSIVSDPIGSPPEYQQQKHQIKATYEPIEDVQIKPLQKGVWEGTKVYGSITTTTWRKCYSPYRVVDDITVVAGNTLTIEPGVDVLFDADRAFVVLGQLNAQGTRQDPISFRPGTAAEWGGIRITGANQVNTLKYLYITGGNADNNAHGGTGGGTDGGGIYTNKIVNTENCTITNNKSYRYGGGCVGVNTEKCIVSYNQTTAKNGSMGGGVRSGTHVNTKIIANAVMRGGGGGANIATLRNCMVSYNYGLEAYGYGAGVYGGNTSDTIISYNISRHNSATAARDGSYTNCVVYGNYNIGYTGIGNVGAQGNDSYTNVVVYTTVATDLATGKYNNRFKNCILWNGASNKAVTSSLPTITYSDVQLASGVYSGIFNINADPLFTDPANGDFTLQSGSPCVGAGESGVNMGISGIVGLTVPESEVGCPDPSPRHLIDPYPQLPYQPPRVNIIIPKHEVTNEAEIGGQNTGEPYNITSNLIGWWKLDGNALDSSSYKNNGTIYGAIPTTDRFNAANKAMYFDGINDYIGGSNLALDRRDFTLCLWAKSNITIAASKYFFGGGTSNTQYNRLFIGYASSTVLRFSFYSNDINWTFTGLVTPTQWNHYAFVHTNKGTSTLYINGRAISTQAHTAEYIGTSAFTIGNAIGRYWWNGSIDNVRVYYEAKTAKDISDIYSCDNVDLLVGSPKELKKKETIIVSSHETFVAESPTKEIIIPRQELYIPETNMDILPQSNRSIEPIEVDKQEEPEIQTEYEQYENEQVKPKLSEIESIIEVTEKYFDYWYVRDATAEDIEVPDWTTPPDDFTIIEGTPVSFTIEATNNPVYTVTGLPAGATIDSATGQFTWTPSSGDILASTTYTGVFRATNAAGYTEATVDISEYNITSGLVGWWKLNGNALDSGPSGYNGTIYGAVASGDRFGRTSGAMYFDGINDYINFGNLNYINSGTSGEFTASVWVNTYSSTQQWIFGDEVASNGGIMFQTENGTRKFCMYRLPVGYFVSTYVLPLSGWCNITVIQNNSGVLLYVNGIYHSVIMSPTYKLIETNNITYAGLWNASSRALKGLVNNIRVYNRALSSGEINQLYHYIGS